MITSATIANALQTLFMSSPLVGLQSVLLFFPLDVGVCGLTVLTPTFTALWRVARYASSFKRMRKESGEGEFLLLSAKEKDLNLSIQVLCILWWGVSDSNTRPTD